MKNSIILPLNYERVLTDELRKSGLIKHIFEDFNFDELDINEDQIYKRSYKIKQNLFQMILLYDKLIVQDSNPLYDYEKVRDISNFYIYPFEDYYNFDAKNQENNPLYAEYLKPAMLNFLKKQLKLYFELCSKESYNKIISEIYDYIFKIKENMSKQTLDFLQINEHAYKLKNINNIIKLKKYNAPIELTENLYWNRIVDLIEGFYNELCWQLKISSEQETYIVNSEFQLSKIGCNIYEKNINKHMEAYKILKCECSNIIGTLPHMNNLQDILLLKKKRKSDVKNLREVINNLENVLQTEGKEKAIIKAVNEVKKASSSLSKCETVSKINKLTTLFSIPIGIAELLLGGGFGGMGLSIIGTATCLIDEKIKRDNSWCEIVR